MSSNSFMENAPAAERQENLRIVEQLRAYLSEGYFLHGSKKRVEIIEPRQAADDNPLRTTGKALAIYAEAEDLRIPVVMALFDKKDPNLKSWRSAYHRYGDLDSVLQIEGENCAFTDGYVYVLPSDTFYQEGGADDYEHISTVPITPIAVIRISPSILSALDNIQINIKP